MEARAKRAARTISLVVLLAAAACSRPMSEAMLVKTEERDDGRYEFVLDMADTVRYGIDLYVLMDCNDKVFSTFSGAKVLMRWTSPSGTVYSEEVWLDRAALAESRYHWKTFRVPYRGSLVPKEYGLWGLSAEINEDMVRRYKISSVGIEMKKDGTR